MARSRVLSMVWALVAVIGALLVAPGFAQAGTPSIPGNPGLPGLKAEVEALGALVEGKTATIETLQAQIAALQAFIDALEPAPVARTGQTASYATGDDGAIQAGVAFPTTRFTDNGDGTVTDNLTGLIWLQNANCFGFRTWVNALNEVNNLADDPTTTTTDCGLTDGSAAGDWRLPNVKELQSLIDFGHIVPALPAGHPFSGVQSSGGYWSSTTLETCSGCAWLVALSVGFTDHFGKASNAAILILKFSLDREAPRPPAPGA